MIALSGLCFGGATPLTAVRIRFSTSSGLPDAVNLGEQSELSVVSSSGRVVAYVNLEPLAHGFLGVVLALIEFAAALVAYARLGRRLEAT